MTDKPRDYYRMDPGAWDFGTAELTLEQEAAYLRIINAIHKHKDGIPDIDRVLAGMFRCSTRKARSLVNDLIKAGKVEVVDGLIVNHRAISDLVQRGFVSVSRAESGAKGGRKRAENARKSLENNNAHQANASTREEKRREAKSIKEDPIGSSKKPAPTKPDPPPSELAVPTEESAQPPPARKRAVGLPEGWVPSDRNLEDARKLDFTDKEAHDEADQFRDHHRSRGSSFKDWDAAWRTWLRNARKFSDRRVAGRSKPAGRGQGGSLASIAAWRRAQGHH